MQDSTGAPTCRPTCRQPKRCELLLLAAGLAALSGQRGAFPLGMALYGVDMIALIVMFSLWAFGVHALFLFKWFQGQKALKDLNEAGISAI